MIMKQHIIVIFLALVFCMNAVMTWAQNLKSYAPLAQCAKHQDWERWQYSDLKSLEPWGNVYSDSCDIIALYQKEETDGFYFRADLLDLRGEAIPSFYFAIDARAGGNTQLEPGDTSLVSDIEWDILVMITDTSAMTVYDTAYAAHPGYGLELHVDLQMDYVEFGLSKDALPGINNDDILFQAFTVNSARDSIWDKSQPVSSTDTTGRAKLVITFMNAFIGYGPNAVSWYDGFALQPTERPGERRGFRYLLDAVEQYKLPLTLNDLRIEQLPGNEYLRINDRIRDLHGQGLLDPLMTLTYGHFMPWQPDDVDAKAIEIARNLRENLQLPVSDIFYPYESMLAAGDIEVIKNAGFGAIFGLDQYRYWTGWIEDWSDMDAVRDDVESLRKIRKIGGIEFLFHTSIGNYHGFIPDSRWEEIDWGSWSEYEQYKGTDEGLHLWWRRILLDMALDEDQEQYFTIGTDILLTPWLFPDVVDGNMHWLASHPWIEVTTFSDLLSRNWGVIDEGDLGLAPDELLIQYPLQGDTHYNAYFPQFYYGGISDGHSPLIPQGVAIESYFDYVPYLRDNSPIPSGFKMGDDYTSGTIIYETLQNLRGAPDNDLTLLAWLSYFMNISEQTFHDGQYLSATAKLKANYVSHVNKIVAAAVWADEAAHGTMPETTQVSSWDLDLDGEEEYILSNDKVFAIFENDGARVEYAFAWSAERGAIELICPTNQYFLMDAGWGWDYGDGEIAIAPTWNRAPDAAFTQTNGSSWDYNYAIFDASINGDTLAFVSQDTHISKRYALEGNTIHAHYDLSGIDMIELGVGLTVNMLNMFQRDWSENIEPVDLGSSLGWRTTEGGFALVNFGGASLISQNSFLDSPARVEMRERSSQDPPYPIGHSLYYPYHCVSLNGAGSFDLSVTLQSHWTTSVEEEDAEIPSTYVLYQNYPNPFNQETNIEFALPQAAEVTVTVYNVLGQVVEVLVDSALPAGYHVVHWNNEGVASGVYLYRIVANDFVATRRMVLMR